jgi:HPt (histidine-containing phosphotransfer) domain-containing protein
MGIIAKSQLESITGDDNELLADLASMFAQLVPDACARIRLGIENRDAQVLESISHQLRSRFSYFGASELQSLAREIETSSRANDLDGIEIKCQAMIDGIDQLIAELRQLTRLPLDVCED